MVLISDIMSSLLKKAVFHPAFRSNFQSYKSCLLPNCRLSTAILTHESSDKKLTKNESSVDGDIFTETGLETYEDERDDSPPLKPSLNFAAYANKSPIIQELVKLGVELYKFEVDTDLCNYILSLDYERDVKNHLIFLHNNGVSGHDFGNFITKFPLIFNEDLENLQIRVNYLESKNFEPQMISRILTANPIWLSHNTQDIDSRLGFLQQTFDLIGKEVRQVSVKQPKLVTGKTENITRSVFTLKEEMGFTDKEIKSIVIAAPNIFMLHPQRVAKTFDVIHQEMKIDHELILSEPMALSCRAKRIQARHLFLKLLKRDQYDPKKECFVSLKALITGSDAEFCKNIAKSTIDSYNIFLKSL